MSQVEQWKGWREDNIGKLKSLSAARPRDMRLKVRIKEFEAAEGGEIERLGRLSTGNTAI